MWILNASGVVIGGLITLVTSWFATTWQARKGEEAATRKRSKDAAEVLLDLVDEVSALFDGLWKHGTAPSQDATRSNVRKIERKSLLLPDPVSRLNIDRVAACFSHVRVLDSMGHGSPSQVAYVIRQEARTTLGAILRDEDVISSEKLFIFESEISAYYDP